ncbi:protein kinase-like protein [Tahibacter aquaticus]|uniref:Protein kinase-like protein n=1 Tax=Tahibacter aquaticus TaxID=520092 RepID=A0A4R6YW50_9GAMM|nr:protein kinase-like protein [Tahibacter aquaticus]
MLQSALRNAAVHAHPPRERPLPARLQHPAVAALLDLGEPDDGSGYLVTEYIDGLPIDPHVREQRRALTPRERLRLPLCDAVAHAHRQRIVHGDIRPGTVLVDRNGRPKLLDVAIAELRRDAAGAAGLQQTAVAPRPGALSPAGTGALSGGVGRLR